MRTITMYVTVEGPDYPDRVWADAVFAAATKGLTSGKQRIVGITLPVEEEPEGQPLADHLDHTLMVADTEVCAYAVAEINGPGVDGTFEVVYGGTREDIETTHQELYCRTCAGQPISVDKIDLSYS